MAQAVGPIAPRDNARPQPSTDPVRGDGRALALASSATAVAAVGLVAVWLLIEHAVPLAYYDLGEVAVTIFVGIAGFAAAWLARSAHMAADRARRASERELARRDGLSGLYNYRHLNEVFDAQLAEACRTGSPCAVVMIDLDDFNNVNDRFGQLAGDGLITAIGAAMCDTVGDRGTVARWGGDEFALILPSCDRGRAEAIAGDVATRIAEASVTAIPENQHMTVSASIGIAVYPEDGADAQAMFAAAGGALHEAKAQRIAVRDRGEERRAQDVLRDRADDGRLAGIGPAAPRSREGRRHVARPRRLCYLARPLQRRDRRARVPLGRRSARRSLSGDTASRADDRTGSRDGGSPIQPRRIR